MLNPAAVKTSPLSRTTRGYLIALVGTTIWSTAAIFIRFLTQSYSLPALVLAFWRDLFVVITLTSVIALTAPKLLPVKRSYIPFLIAYGLLLSVFNSSWSISVALNGAAVSTVLAYSSSAITAILAWRLFKEKLDLLKILAVSLSLAGTVFVSSAYDLAAWGINPIGILAGLLSGFAFAGYSLMGKSASQRGIQPWTVMLYTFAFATPFLLAYNLLPYPQPVDFASPNLFWLRESWAGWSVLVLLAIGPTIGGYGLYTVSLGYLPASVANLIATLEPAMTAAWAYLLLGERMTGPQLFGSALIIAGVIILRWRERLLSSNGIV